jgi:hypothetical protein
MPTVCWVGLIGKGGSPVGYDLAFMKRWERSASLGLREGRPPVPSECGDHGRIRQGHHSELVDCAYAAWHSDILAGRISVLIAPDNETVQMLNGRAQADRVSLGDVERNVPWSFGTGFEPAVATSPIARRNDRSILDDRGDFLHCGTKGLALPRLGTPMHLPS